MFMNGLKQHLLHLGPQADTEEGLTKGISGIQRHTPTFVQIQKFDSVAKSFFQTNITIG